MWPKLLLPALCLPTGELHTAPTAYPPSGDRGVMMPTRHRTREQDRAYRIDAERALKGVAVAA
jgi:membrane-bound lytic murein transglycosylase MltF